MNIVNSKDEKITGYALRRGGDEETSVITLIRSVEGSWKVSSSNTVPVNIDDAKEQLNAFNAAFAELALIEGKSEVVKPMNKHILLIMQWLANKDSVTTKELVTNKDSAHQEYFDSSGDEFSTAAYTAAYNVLHVSAEYLVHYLEEYFLITQEDKSSYEKQVSLTLASMTPLSLKVGQVYVVPEGKERKWLKPKLTITSIVDSLEGIYFNAIEQPNYMHTALLDDWYEIVKQQQ